MDKLRIEEGRSFTDDYLEARVCGKDIVLEVCNPWSGDTETGFGREGNITLSAEKARQLAAFLLEHAQA